MYLATSEVIHSEHAQDVWAHYVREAVQDGVIDLHYCPTRVMIADLLTIKAAIERTF